MDPNLFIKKNPFDDIEIRTLDSKIKYYTCKGWLYSISNYFRTIFESNFLESQTNIIDLNHSPHIILTLFRCLYYGFMGDEHIKGNYLSSLNSIDDVAEFFDVCNEYQLISLMNLLEKFLHQDRNSKLISFFDVKLFRVAILYDLKMIKEELCYIISCDSQLIKKINFKKIDCKEFLFFISSNFHPSIFFSILKQWLVDNNPNDEVLFKLKLDEYDYKKLAFMSDGSMSYAFKELIRTIRKLKNADRFKNIVMEKISYILIAE